VRYATSSDNATLKASPLVNWLFSVRWRLGKALGWDGERQQVGTRVESLRDQLPEDLRVRRGTDMELAPFRSVFLTDDEWTAEFSASIGHIVMHHGWVRGENGVRYSQMTSLVMRVRSRGQFVLMPMATRSLLQNLPVSYCSETTAGPMIAARPRWTHGDHREEDELVHAPRRP
jgi:hypothetical protein